MARSFGHGRFGLQFDRSHHYRYLPHELFYSFAPSCPLDAVVSTPPPDPATTADEFALQYFERLQEATAFVRDFTGRNIARMKKLYDSSVKPQSYKIGRKVLVYDPRSVVGVLRSGTCDGLALL